MKVEEAKQKICPFITAVNHGGWSRDNGAPANIKCICGDCMAWVWDKARIAEYDGHPAFTDNSTSSGYCSRLKP